jgi:hypothetical protein
MEDSMFGSLPITRRRLATAAGVFVLGSMLATTADAGCWSILKSPKWADVQASLGTSRLCEVLPAGPNHTDKLSISVFDVCDAPGGIRLHAEASLKCKSGSGALIRMKATASVKADVAMDIGTCTVTTSHVDLGGTLGSAFADRPEIQTLVKTLAQAKLSQLCGNN